MAAGYTSGGGVPPQTGIPHNLVSGQKTVTTAGTAEKLLGAADPATATVIIKALATNTDLIFIGNVSDDVASTNGFILSPGEGMSINIDNSKTQLYIDSAVNGEGVSFTHQI